MQLGATTDCSGVVGNRGIRSFIFFFFGNGQALRFLEWEIVVLHWPICLSGQVVAICSSRGIEKRLILMDGMPAGVLEWDIT